MLVTVLVSEGLSDEFKHDPVDAPFYVNSSTHKPGQGTAVFHCTAGVLKHSDVETLAIHWERAFDNGTSFPVNSTRMNRYVQFQASLVSTLQIDQPELTDFDGGYRCVATQPELPGKISTSKTGRLIQTGS